MDLPTADRFLAIELRDDAVVASFTTPLILGGQIADIVTERLTLLLSEAAPRPLTLDFANVRGLNSLMLGKLVQLNNAAKRAGTRLIIVNAAANVRKILEVTRLDTLLCVVETT
jgi:anti-anti-sigma factor